MNGSLIKIQLETKNLNIEEQKSNFLLMPRHRIISDLVLKYCGKKEEIVDIGCGNTCGQLLYLQDQGYENLSGVDFNITTAFKDINLIEQDLEEPLKTAIGYDAAILADVIEHSRYPRLILKNALNNIRVDGLIFLSVPNAGHFYNGILLTLLPRHLNMSSAFGPWGHYSFLTYYSLKKLFEVFDLEIVEFKGSSLEFRYMSMHWTKRAAMWVINIVPVLLNFGFFRKYFSDHLYFVLRKKNNNFLRLDDKIIYEANI